MSSALTYLKRLEALRFEFGAPDAQEKQACLQALESASFKTAAQVLRLHETLCFIQAWPDNPAVLSLVDAMLERFDRRTDLRSHAEALTDSGIAGTSLYFRFYAATAQWLAQRWPNNLHIDWDDFENASRLERYLGVLACFSETITLENAALTAAEWLERLKGSQETDASFVIRRLAEQVPNGFLFEQLYDEFDFPLVLSPGADTPSRTRAKYPQTSVHYQSGPIHRNRPCVEEELQVAAGPSRLLTKGEGTRLVNLAHAAMATRHRDLDAFAYADPGDVCFVEDRDLTFVLYGVVPERRFLLETLYGFMILRCGVPIGYGSFTCLFHSAEVAFTLLDTFRGVNSAYIYARTLAVAHQTFGCDTFMVNAYQVGEENDDAIQSGAWWFYQKLGFRPRGKHLLRLMNEELAKLRRRPNHRSSPSVLRRLAAENVYLDLCQQRDDVIGRLNFEHLGLRITDLLARRFGSDRQQGEKILADEAAERLGVQTFAGWTASERTAWRRWAAVVALLPNLSRWPPADRQALVELIRAKGARQELEYLQRFDAHARLRRAILKQSTK